MLVYKCPRCGNKYTKDMVPKSEMCPHCDIYLKIVNIKQDNVIGIEKNERIVQNNSYSRSVGRVGRARDDSSAINEMPALCQLVIDEKKRRTDEYPSVGNIGNDTSSKYDANKSYIEGTIVSATDNAGYRRFLWERVFDRYYYSQHVNDTQNTIYVRCIDENGNVINKKIVFYGQVRGGIGIFPTGMKIKGEGKYNRKNEFMARSLVVEDNIAVGIRTEMADIMYYFSPLLVVSLIFVLFNVVIFFRPVLNGQYLEWLLLSIVGGFGISYYIIGRITRIPIVNRIRTSFWIGIILGFVIFFLGLSILFS
ncbi:MAG: hypothetical protein ACI4GW_09195 [Lachnospiraceae bacterium]